MRTLTSIFAASFAVLAMLGTVSAVQSADLRFGHSFAEGSLEDRAINQIADHVKKRTNGDVNIQVFPANQLGSIGATFSALTLGTVDMTMLDVSLLGYQKGHEEFFVGQVPFLFKSQAHARRAYNSRLFDDMYKRLREQKGIRVLSVAGDRAPRALNTTVGPIFNPEDAKGITMRVLSNPISIKSFDAWGMRPTPLNFGELYLAMRQGVVEGQDNGLDVTVPNNFHEITSYYAYLNHVRSLYGWYISEKTWQRLSETARAIVVEEAEKAGEMISSLGQDRMERDLKTILDTGLKVTIPDRAAFEALSRDIYKEFEGTLWREGLVADILAMQD